MPKGVKRVEELDDELQVAEEQVQRVPWEAIWIALGKSKPLAAFIRSLKGLTQYQIIRDEMRSQIADNTENIRKSRESIAALIVTSNPVQKFAEQLNEFIRPGGSAKRIEEWIVNAIRPAKPEEKD